MYFNLHPVSCHKLRQNLLHVIHTLNVNFEIYLKRTGISIWRCVYRASYWNVLMTNEMHNSYNQFYSTVFLCLLYMLRTNLFVHHQEHCTIYYTCILHSFGTIVRAGLHDCSDCKGVWWRRFIAPLILNLGAGWRWAVNFKPPPPPSLCLRAKTLVDLSIE